MTDDQSERSGNQWGYVEVDLDEFRAICGSHEALRAERDEIETEW